MLKYWSSSPTNYTFQPKSRSNRSNDSIAFFFVVGAFEIGTNFDDNLNIIVFA
jgi:hypothetical protein